VTKQLNERQFVVPEYVNNEIFNKGGRKSFSAWVLTIPEELVQIILKEDDVDDIDQASYGSSICLSISGVQIDEVLGCKIITGANNIERDFSQGNIYHWIEPYALIKSSLRSSSNVDGSIGFVVREVALLLEKIRPTLDVLGIDYTCNNMT
jgi:hypothetical protein